MRKSTCFGITRWLGLAAAVLLAGCTAVGLAYQRLDWYAAWRIDRYVSLNSVQKAQRQEAVARFWDWHRTHELPRYARDLREIASVLDRPASPEVVRAYVERSEAYWRSATAQTLPDLCAVMQSLDARQAAQVLTRIDEDNREFAEKYVEAPEAERRRDTGKRLAKSIRRWTGPLNERQEALLSRWAQERRDIAPDWLDYRRQWRQQFAQALSQRQAPGMCARFEPLMVRPLDQMEAGLEAQRRANERRWMRLIADIVAAMDAEQREHARHKLGDLARELEEMSRARA